MIASRPVLLQADLLDALTMKAKECNRSLRNYLEAILWDHINADANTESFKLSELSDEVRKEVEDYENGNREGVVTVGSMDDVRELVGNVLWNLLFLQQAKNYK